MESLPVIALHPTAAADYRREVEHLFATLANDPGHHVESIPKLRGLIGRIDVYPADTGRGTRIEVTARMNAMLALATRSEEHTSELQSLMRISYAVFCLNKKN